MEKLNYEASNFKIIKKINEIIDMVNKQEVEKERENEEILKGLEKKISDYHKAMGTY